LLLFFCSSSSTALSSARAPRAPPGKQTKKPRQSLATPACNKRHEKRVLASRHEGFPGSQPAVLSRPPQVVVQLLPIV
jgi:hypothetical protein